MVGTMRSRWLVLTLLVLLIGLVPLAYASPPDQTWLAGFYDNADYDDAVLAVTSTVGASDAAPAPDLGRLVSVIETLRPSEPAPPEPGFRSPYRFRAPPLV